MGMIERTPARGALVSLCGLLMGSTMSWTGCGASTVPGEVSSKAETPPGARSAESCRADADCGDGFCDRTGRCEVVDLQTTRFGASCEAPPRDAAGRVEADMNPCGAYLCVDARCRSCVDDNECQKELGAPTCGHLESHPGARCGDYSQ